MKSRLEFYAWYAGDFRRDTQHLTRDERAAYREILDEIFITDQEECSLPDNDEYLARIVQRPLDEWKMMRFALLDGPKPLIGKRLDGRIFSARLQEEIRIAQQKSDIQSKRSRDYWDSRKKPTDNPPDTDGKQSASISKSLSGSPTVTKNEDVTTGPVAEAIAAYRELATEWHSPGLTNRKADQLAVRIERVTEELLTECEGFNWRELMKRARSQKYIHETIRSFDFEWFLKREYQGTRLNARKVWYGQFGSGNGGRGQRRDEPGGATGGTRRQAFRPSVGAGRTEKPRG